MAPVAYKFRPPPSYARRQTPMDYSFDVEIYRQIRQDPSKREILLRGLRNHRRRCVKQLLDHPTFAAAFDTLLDIPCLRDGIRLTTIHKHFSWKCDEVV